MRVHHDQNAPADRSLLTPPACTATKRTATSADGIVWREFAGDRHNLIMAARPHEATDWQQIGTFPRKRLVKLCTKRFRGNAGYVATGAITIQADALSAANPDEPYGRTQAIAELLNRSDMPPSNGGDDTAV